MGQCQGIKCFWVNCQPTNESVVFAPIDQSQVFNLLTLNTSLGPDQRKIFQPLQPGVRKIVISTNIAESSVTINDIVYVVDCGMAKMKKYDAENNADRLHVDWISKANSKQRKGQSYWQDFWGRFGNVEM